MASVSAEQAVQPGEQRVMKRTRSGVRIPIRVKITFPYLILAAALAIGAAYITTNIVFDTLEERFTNQLIESGKLASEWMVREEERLLMTLRLLSYTQGIAQAVQVGDAEAIRQLTFGIVVNNHEEAVEFLNDQGRLVLSMQHIPGGKVEEYTFSSHGDQVFTQWDFASDVLQGKSDSHGDKHAGWALTDWGDYFYISSPVYDAQGNFSGVILVGKRLSTLVSQIREETLTQVTLYDFNGIPLASTFHDAPTLSEAELANLLERQDTNTLQRSLTNRRELNVTNIDYSEIMTPWEVRGGVDQGALGTALVKSFLVSTSQVTRLQITLVVAFSFLLVILIGYYIANFITRPLMNLVQASTQVAQGNFNVHVAPNTGDEVSVLTASFNNMVLNLKASQQELLEAYDRTLEGWSRALELRDEDTEGHAIRVTALTMKISRKLDFSEDELTHIQRGALLHDIGKMGIPDVILLKPGKLTPEEWQVMRKHPVYAYEMLSPIEYLHPALEIPYYHHEWWDGSGYPIGLKGEEIPLSARIFAVVDSWDAMTSDRPYRAAKSEAEALEIITSTSGTHFDPQIVSLFLSFVNGQHEEGSEHQ
jgi:HD-GYP domain-containing protein (c-di-GMP phosphodiesterase class II)